MSTKTCACPGCDVIRVEGKIFCQAHQWSDSRLRFIAKQPAPTNAQLAFIMQRDGYQQ